MTTTAASKTITDKEAVAELELWKMKGHRPLDALRVFGVDGGLIAGLTDYTDMETVLIPHSLAKPQPSYAKLFGRVGALFDQMQDDDE